MADGITQFAGAMLTRALIDSANDNPVVQQDADKWLASDFADLIAGLLNMESMLSMWYRLSISERRARLADAKVSGFSRTDKRKNERQTSEIVSI